MSATPVYITNTSAFLPGDPVANDEMEHYLGLIAGKPSRARRMILRSNGIKSRYYAIDKETQKTTHTNAQLTAEAVRLLQNDRFDITSISCLATGTSTPDQIMPNHGLAVHGELGIPCCEVSATAGICVSGMTAMKYAFMAVAAGLHKNAVATGSEVVSPAMQAHNFSAESDARIKALESSPEIAFEKDFLRWMLSDGAGAVLLQPEPEPGKTSFQIDWIDIRSYANEMETCMYAGAEKVDGKLVGWNQYSSQERSMNSIMAIKQDIKLLNQHVIHYTVEKPLAEFIATRNLKTSEIDWFLPHFSSHFFKEKVYAGLQKIDFEIPYDKWYSNLAERGNTGAASIYILLDELAKSGKVRPGQKILCYIPESGRFSSCFMHLTVI